MKSVALLLLFAGASFAGVAQTETQAKQLTSARAYYAYSSAPYPYIDSGPAFPGGKEKWNNYVTTTAVFKAAVEKAKQQNMPMGVYTVIIRFAVNADGSVSDIKTLGKPFGYGLEDAAIQLIKNSGKWTPANIEGENTKGYLQMPIRFSIIY